MQPVIVVLLKGPQSKLPNTIAGLCGKLGKVLDGGHGAGPVHTRSPSYLGQSWPTSTCLTGV